MVVNFRGKDINAAGVRVSGTKITATPDEINQALDGISADVTAANLSELTGGAETDLHSHAASGGGSGVLVATVPITAAELKALHTTPKQLVAAPGAGKFLFPQRTLFDFTPGVVPYTNPNNSSFYAIYGTPPDIGTNRVTYYDAAILTNAGRTISPEPVTTADYDASAVSNKAINLTLDQAVLNGDGTLTVSVAYLVI